MKFAFIKAEKANHEVSLMCRVLGVSRSGFYAWCSRPPSERARMDARLSAHVVAIHGESRKTYGSPRIHAELKAQDVHVSRKRVARLMSEYGICARRKRRFVHTTDSNHSLPVAKNVLARNFSPPAPNRSWAADITYIPTRAGWLFLAVVLDLYSRKIIGWAMSDRIDTSLATAALKMAIESRGPSSELIHHSDRGCQYASHEYRGLLVQASVIASMSRTGNCWDNACVESFFSSVKNELVHHRDYSTREEARQDLFEYIEIFYNRKRRHSALGYKTPSEYENLTIAKAA